MSYKVTDIKESIAHCGLVCALCNEKKLGKCSGCRGESKSCSIKRCAQDYKNNGCWECTQFPCGQDMFKNIRLKVFLQCAKNEGIHQLATYLKRNYDKGIHYHKEDGTPGDYDILNDEVRIMNLLTSGNRINPYTSPPRYESQHLFFRLVEENDAIDLLECYSDKHSGKLFNSDNCINDFRYQTLEEMKECIRFWKEEYKKHSYVRLSILDKCKDKAIGTIEIFAKKEMYKDVGKVGLLRIDLASVYEEVVIINEILEMVDENFFMDFEIDSIITKAISMAKKRITTLESKGYRQLDNKNITAYSDYYIKNINVN